MLYFIKRTSRKKCRDGIFGKTMVFGIPWYTKSGLLWVDHPQRKNRVSPQLLNQTSLSDETYTNFYIFMSTFDQYPF